MAVCNCVSGCGGKFYRRFYIHGGDTAVPPVPVPVRTAYSFSYYKQSKYDLLRHIM